MAEQEINWITLVDEDGNEFRFNLVNIVEVDEVKYAVMVPENQAEQSEEEEEAVIFRIETDDAGEEVLVDLEDDEEFAKVCEALEDILEDEEDGPEEQ